MPSLRIFISKVSFLLHMADVVVDRTRDFGPEYLSPGNLGLVIWARDIWASDISATIFGVPGGIVWPILIAIVWGVTNPLMKRYSAGLEKVHQNGLIRQYAAELKFLLLQWKYVVSFLTNISGSVLYYITLASSEMSLVAPVTNSLTFVVTTVVGYFLGEQTGGKRSVLGIAFVILGIFCCIVGKA